MADTTQALRVESLSFDLEHDGVALATHEMSALKSSAGRLHSGTRKVGGRQSVA